MQEAIRAELKMDQYGGRVVTISQQTFVVYDVACVPCKFIENMKHARIEVLTDSSSLSGFILKISMKPDQTMRVVTVWTVLVFLFYVLSMQFHRI